ncbi:MAG: hypothetical protein ABSH33_17055 [Steroidobacteraceae bacterium]|jgi:hypothetical protein
MSIGDSTSKSQMETAAEPLRDMSHTWDIAVIRAIARLRIGNMPASGYTRQDCVDSIRIEPQIPPVGATGGHSDANDGNL